MHGEGGGLCLECCLLLHYDNHKSMAIRINQVLYSMKLTVMVILSRR